MSRPTHPRARTGMKIRSLPLLPVLLLLPFLPPSAAAQEWEPQVERGAVEGIPRGDLFIEELDEVWTAAGEVLQGASILIRDGVIREIGPGLRAPGGVRVVDGRGLTAIPGLVDEHSHIAMRATNEGTVPISAEVRVLDALEPEDFGIYRALSGGVTTARIMHGSANPIGGQSAVIKARWDMDRADQLLFEGAPRFVKFALGENVTRKNWRAPGRPVRFPASRPGVEALYEEAFTAAREYRDAWTEYRDDPGSVAVAPRRDLRLEALLDILEGRIRIHAHSYRADEILMLMRVAERFDFEIDVFTHVLEGYQVADEMAAHGAGGSTFSDWWQYKLEAFDATPYNAAIMHEQGVLTAINSDIPWLQSFMIHEYPKAVKYGGVAREEALRMLTLYPARMMYIDDRVGSLEVGKDGDVVLLNGDPFSMYTRVETTVVDGIVYYDLSDEEGTRGEAFNPVPGSLQPGLASWDAPDEPGHWEGLIPASELVRAPVVALVGGTVHPVSRPAIEDGVVVVRDGVISAVGPSGSVEIPAGAERVDVSGRHVYPGMIDPVTGLGLIEFGQSGNATDLAETGEYNPHVRAVVAVQHDDPALNVARANGITAALTAQISGTIQGTAAVIQLDGDSWERLAVEPDVALMVNFPAPGEPEEPDDEPSLDDDDDVEELVEFFRRAREFAARPTTRSDPTAPFEPNVWGGDRPVLEAMVPVMRDSRPVFFRVSTEHQIRTLFLLLDEFPEIRPVIVGAGEAWKVADELVERGISVVITEAYSPTRDRDDSITAAFRNAAVLHARGVRFAFGTASTADVRNLPYHASHSVAFGLPYDAALRAVTLGPAEILGLGDTMGSIDEGKRGDLIVTDGDPLDLLTVVERMFIAGREVDPRDNKHYRLYLEYLDR